MSRHRRNKAPSGIQGHKQFIYDDQIKESALHELVSHSSALPTCKPASQDQNRTIMKGLVSATSYETNLSVHASDTIELCDYSTSAMLDPSLKICLVYNGCIEGTIGHLPYLLDATSGPTGYFWTLAKRTSWSRTIQKNMRVSKVIITIPHSWLIPQLRRHTMDTDTIRTFIDGPTSIQKWTPSKRTMTLGRSILGRIKESDIVSKIRMESSALEILGEVIEAIQAPEKNALRLHSNIENQAKANQIRDLIEHNIDQELNLTRLAKDLGMGINSLQRTFKSAYGMTVMDYIRERRLVAAKDAMEREGLTITQAAYRAGYSSPANFSTAFKRVFGITPSELQN